MKPVPFASPTAFVLAPPPGHDNNIDPLPAERVTVAGMPGIASVWEFDEAELHAIAQRGGRVRLTVLGQAHPPVLLEVVER